MEWTRYEPMAMAPRKRHSSDPSSLDSAFRAVIQHEVEAQLQPLQAALSQIQSLVSLTDRLSPLMSLLGGGSLPTRRGPGRPPGRPSKASLAAGAGTARSRACAIIGCKRPSRTKGYCAAHYQKLRMLIRSDRRPADWIDFAAPASVKDIVLPRGRAAHKARRQDA